jgi:flavodoxin
MKSLVIYTTRSGNTKAIAEAIAETMRARGDVEVFDADRAPIPLPESDLIFIGGPTERHRLTPSIGRFLDRLAPGSLQGKATAAFDTRAQWPRFLSGSAADDIATRLRAADAHTVVQPESFFIRLDHDLGYLLEPGELTRAATWAAEVADEVNVEVAVG